MNRRLVAICALGTLLAPGTWLRTPSAPENTTSRLVLSSLKGANDTLDIGEATLVRGWHLQSSNSDFGGYSALVFLDRNRFLAGSDQGTLLEFSVPGDDRQNETPVFLDFPDTDNKNKAAVDLESLTRHPITGTIWAGFERRNTIERVGHDYDDRRSISPSAMRDWAVNSGAESLLRLRDGRFLVIAEGESSEGPFPVIIFDGDPLTNKGFVKYSFNPPSGYRPVDAAQLPNGRVIILTRDFDIALPPQFETKLVVVDPVDLSTADPWEGRTIATITDPAIADNYEGIAIAPSGDDVTIWLISDDNNSTFQRTLLLELTWKPS